MDIVINTSNFFHSSSVTHHEFGALLEEIGSECGEIIYPSDVTWLISRSVLKEFF
jgi:nanoRNase/pAp phosphatase (c-di-AMP/oligoRNAs hydrolase)